MLDKSCQANVVDAPWGHAALHHEPRWPKGQLDYCERRAYAATITIEGECYLIRNPTCWSAILVSGGKNNVMGD
jgi:hypothetical protein